MITIHIIASQLFISNHLNRFEGVLNGFNNATDFNIIYHKSSPAYYDETDFRGRAFIKHDIYSSEYETDYHNQYKSLYNEFSENPYDFEKGHEVFFEIINKYRILKYPDKNRIDDGDYVFLLTEVRGEPGWLSATDHKKNCYIHTNDWEYIIKQAELIDIKYAFEWCIISSIFQNLFHSLIQITYLNASEMSHVKVNHSCISDFAQNKLDFIQSMFSGRICKKCMSKFMEQTNDLLLFQKFSKIFKDISSQFEEIPGENTIFNHEMNLIINYKGVQVGTVDEYDIVKSAQTIINIERKQAFIIYLFLLKFDNIPFDFNKIKKLKNEQYWDYIYKCYTFCLKLYRLVYGIDADISGRNFLRNIFYTFKNDNVKAIFEDENDKPKFINSKGQLSNYTNLKSEITKLSGIRKQIESIIKQENPLKAYIIRKVVEKHKNIKRVGSLNYDIYTPVIKRQAMWHIDYDRTNLKWGSDELSQSLKNSWLSETTILNY